MADDLLFFLLDPIKPLPLGIVIVFDSICKPNNVRPSKT